MFDWEKWTDNERFMNGRINKLFEQTGEQFEWMLIFCEWIGKLFEWMLIFFERRHKPFECRGALVQSDANFF